MDRSIRLGQRTDQMRAVSMPVRLTFPSRQPIGDTVLTKTL
jgi:hypothetical protein